MLRDDVGAPLGVAGELFLGVPADHLDRLARLEEGNWSTMLAVLSEHIEHFDLVAPPGVRPDAALGNREDIRSADVPAVGTLSARAAARMYAALVGEVDGVRLIGPDRLATVTAPATSGPDWTFGQDLAKGLGYFLEDGSFEVSGNGGSLAWAYPEPRLSIAATRNLVSAGTEGDDPMEDLRAEIREALCPR